MDKRSRKFYPGQQVPEHNITPIINETNRDIRNEAAKEEIVNILRKMLLGLRQANPAG